MIKKILIFLATVTIYSISYAIPPATYYYTLQHYQILSSTNITGSTVNNKMKFRGNYEIYQDTYTVFFASMTPNVVIYGTGTVVAKTFEGSGAGLTSVPLGIIMSTQSFPIGDGDIYLSSVTVGNGEIGTFANITIKLITFYTSFISTAIAGNSAPYSCSFNIAYSSMTTLETNPCLLFTSSVTVFAGSQYSATVVPNRTSFSGDVFYKFYFWTTQINGVAICQPSGYGSVWVYSKP